MTNLPTPGGTKAARGLTARATPKQASIALLGSNPTIRASTMGAASYWAWGRHRPGPGPWQGWLGQNWDPEDLYGVGDALTETVDKFAVDEYADAYLTALKGAFPE